jgi:hypothetical protein
MGSRPILHPDPTLMNKNPKLAAHTAIESLKEFFGPDYNLWAVLAELCRQIEVLRITYDGFIDSGKYVMVLRQEADDENQAAFVKELLTKVFRDLSRMKVEVAVSPRRISLGVELDSIPGG